jgi:hypothetical protein
MFLGLIPYALVGVALWFVYGWGSQVVENYGAMAKTIQRLERDKALIESRVDSYKTLLARRDAAIAASNCKAKIEYYVKNPEKLPQKSNPFQSEGGG